MKRIFAYILLLSTMLMVGCTKEFDGMFYATMEDYRGGNGKVYLNEDGFACWNNQDEVRGYVGGSGDLFANMECGNGVARFQLKFKLDLGTVAYIVPATINTGADVVVQYPKNSSCGSTIMRISNQQVYSETTVGVDRVVQKLEAPMVAHAQAGQDCQLKFFNLAGVIKVNVTNSMANSVTVDKIRLSGSTAVAGEVSYIQGWNEVPTEIGYANENRWDTIELAGGVQNGTAMGLNKVIQPGESRSFYIYVVPGQSCAYTVEVLDSRGVTLFNKTTVPITIGRNEIAMMVATISEGTIVPDGSREYPYEISSARQWDSIMRAPGGLEKSYVLINDIDMSEIDNFGGFKGYGDYYTSYTGIFDGDGHTIYNGSRDNPSRGGVFHNIDNPAIIRNVKVIVNMNYSNPESYDSKGGFINGTIGGGIIENCEVSGTMSVYNNGYVGGFIGFMGSGSMKNCVSRVQMEGKYLGGLVGECSTHGIVVNIVNCVSKGHLNATQKVGGLACNVYNSTILNISNCYVLGKIEKGDNNDNAGGIMGYVVNATATINNVYMDAELVNAYAIVGGGNNATITNESVYVPSSYNGNYYNGAFTWNGAVTSFDNYATLKNNLNIYRNTHNASEWAEWVDGVTGNEATGGGWKPGFGFESRASQP